MSQLKKGVAETLFGHFPFETEVSPPEIPVWYWMSAP